MIAAAYDEADRRDPQRVRQRVFLVDGNKQQITAVEAQAGDRGLKVPVLIDYIHVSGYIGKAAAALHPGDPCGWPVGRRAAAPRPARTGEGCRRHPRLRRREDPRQPPHPPPRPDRHGRFDYHREGHSYATVSVAEVVDSDRELDYALLRLADSAALSGREQIAVVRERPDLPRGARLNIVQCPGGGPLRYAIRNNFFVGPGQHPYEMRYLTDTRQGSSGSPVLNDSWQVVAMHKGYKKVDPGLFQAETGKSEVVKYHNEGIVITDILRRLPAVIRDEINNAQGWFAQVGSAVSTQRWDCGGGRTQI